MSTMHRYFLGLFVVVSSALTWACVTNATANTTTEPQTCGAKAQLLAGTTAHRIRVDRVKRTYRMFVPDVHEDSVTMPLVIVLHGGFGRGRTIQRQTGFDELATRHGFVVVYPDGRSRSWNAGGCCGKAMEGNVDDVGFISKLIDTTQKSLCIDDKRVYATGFSNGSMLAHRLACDLSSKVTAIAAVSGVSVVGQCRPTRMVPVLVIHGTQDPRSMWSGGAADKDLDLGPRPGIPETMNTLYARAGCSATEEVFFERGDARCTRRSACEGEAEIALCRIDNHGHQWPGGEETNSIFGAKIDLGPMSRDLPANEIIWQFFERYEIAR